MIQILLFMLFISCTTQASELQRQPSTSSVDNGLGASPVKRSFSTTLLEETDPKCFELPIEQIITGTLSTLISFGYFSKDKPNGVLRLTYSLPCADSQTVRPQISSIKDEDLRGVTRIIVDPRVFSKAHAEKIFEELRKKNITVVIQS